MTADERVEAVSAFGFTHRQARFLVTVALHGGYCLRRQYQTFAGIRYGKNVRVFLDRLVAIGLADRFTGRVDRGHVYHIHGRSLYGALGQEDNRNRRPASPAQIARKLMLLDIVIARSDVTWYATERDKVDLFIQQFGVPLYALPCRMAERSAPTESGAARYFVDKLPIYTSVDAVVAHFVYLSVDGSCDAFLTFLRTHAALFHHLRRWTVVVVGRTRCTAFQAVFDRFVATSRPEALQSSGEVEWYFERRRVLEDGNLAQVPVADLRRFRALQQQFDTCAHHGLYADWVVSRRLEANAGARASTGSLVIETLPSAYQQFGSLPGVA